MARKSYLVFWHLISRLIGLTGALAAAIGLVLWLVADEEIGRQIALGGGAAVALALLVELAALVRLATSRRGAVGSNVLLQVVLATLILGGVNVFSFLHYQRFDWTSKREFTLDEKLRAELSKLSGEEPTTIVVYRRQTSIGPQGKADPYAVAADKKIIEKVRDLVEQFQELGPRFRVQNLDIDDEQYEENLAQIKKDSPALGAAIENAPENSIFFYSRIDSQKEDGKPRENVQRLGFHDIYELDKQASQEADGGKGNLVLRYQGAGPFARRVLNVDAKTPRVAVAAVFDTDGLDSPPPWGMSGAKNALAAHGFDSYDIILKRDQFVVLTSKESEAQRIEAQLQNLVESIKDWKEELGDVLEQQKIFQGTLAELNKEFALAPVPVRAQVGGLLVVRIEERIVPRELIPVLKKNNPRTTARDVDEKKRSEALENIARVREEIEGQLKKEEGEKKELIDRKGVLNTEELAEKRRITDLKAKFGRMLADCDLLIVPRLTLVDLATRQMYNYATYRVDDAQAEAIRDYIKSGKPVLFCLSPPGDEKDGAGDLVDKLIDDLGIRMGRDTVFYDQDARAMDEARAERDSRKAQTQAPPVDVEWPLGAGLLASQKKTAAGARHPLRTSLRLGTRLGKNEHLDVRLRHPRPVYAVTYRIPPEISDKNAVALAGLMGVDTGPVLALAQIASSGKEAIDESAVFLLSGSDAWNEKQPVRPDGRTPRFRRPKADDPSVGTLSEKRRGPFPIAAAVETQPPLNWYPDAKSAQDRPTVRVAVIGHGGAFIGASLNPAQEKLLLDTCNWLLGRDDLLAREDEPWTYPRVSLSDAERSLWIWGAWGGLPFLFGYLGMVMLLVRRMR